MLSHKDKISFRQAMILFMTLAYSPSIRFFPTQAAKDAKQAGWLTPFVAFILLALLVLVFDSFYKKHINASFMDIVCSIAGKILGNILLVIYALWLIVLLGLYVRYYAVRITTVMSPATDVSFFIIIMLILIAFVLRYGLVVFARMSEVIFIILLIGFVILFAFSIPTIKTDNLTPLSYLDIIPVIKGSYSLIGIWTYFVIIFFFSDKISNKEMIKKTGIKSVIVLMISVTMLGIMTIGSLGYSVIARSSLPFFMTVKNMSFFETINRIEALSVTQLITSDFILIITFFYSLLSILKYLFNTQDFKFLIGIFTIFIYFISMYISQNQFELEDFSTSVIVPLNVLFGFIIPVLLFALGKLRKKI